LTRWKRRRSWADGTTVDFFCANDIFATRQPVLRRQKDPKADRVNDVLSAVTRSADLHAACGRGATIQLYPHNNTGQASRAAVPKSKAAAALPVDFAMAPATAGPSIIAA
jgi:hypothetical protein